MEHAAEKDACTCRACMSDLDRLSLQIRALTESLRTRDTTPEVSEHSAESGVLRLALEEMLQKRHLTEYATKVCPCCSAVREVLRRVIPPEVGNA